jgi:hypothetical protein
MNAKCVICDDKRAEVEVIDAKDRAKTSLVCDSCHRTYYLLNLFRRLEGGAK